MLNLFAIKKLNYIHVNDPYLPVKPDNNPQFVYTGRGFQGKPHLLEEYIRGRGAFSEKRRREIREFYIPKSANGVRTSLYPNCRRIADAIFNQL